MLHDGCWRLVEKWAPTTSMLGLFIEDVVVNGLISGFHWKYTPFAQSGGQIIFQGSYFGVWESNFSLNIIFKNFDMSYMMAVEGWSRSWPQLLIWWSVYISIMHKMAVEAVLEGSCIQIKVSSFVWGSWIHHQILFLGPFTCLTWWLLTVGREVGPNYIYAWTFYWGCC